MGIRSASVSVCCGLLLAGSAVAGATSGATADATSSSYAVTPCSSGLVALTFDDGPSPSLTPDFLDLLHERRVPATFFVIGGRVRANPAPTRRASRLGFTIGNQTFSHENLPSHDAAAIKRTLRRTQRAIKEAGADPSNLMRPPFGSIDERVRAIVREVGLVPVLWTADPRDWDGRSSRAIAGSVLAQLDAHEPNIVLLHDGVDNSARTLRALPRILREARARGYCFADLGPDGRPTPPVPRVRVSDASTDEAPGGAVMTFALTLDRPTSRPISVRVRTVEASATAGDYARADTRVRFPVGTTKQVVRVRIRDDLRDERTERFTVRLSEPRGLGVRDGEGIGRIRDDDPPPRLTLRDTEVTEPGSGQAEIAVVLRLSRASERWIRVTVTTEPQTAGEDDYVPQTRRLAFSPGEITKPFVVAVLADAVDEQAETFGVHVLEGSNVETHDAAGTVTIFPASD